MSLRLAIRRNVRPDKAAYKAASVMLKFWIDEMEQQSIFDWKTGSAQIKAVANRIAMLRVIYSDLEVRSR